MTARQFSQVCTFVFVIAFTILTLASGANAQDSAGKLFSDLPRTSQYQIRGQVAPPPPTQRYGCYSTPMYYLMAEGYEYQGDLDKDPDKRCYSKVKGQPGPDYGFWRLDRNRPDWQEAMIQDWVQLGLNNTHLNIFPEDDSLTISDAFRQALIDFVRLSHQYGLKIGVRLDAPGGYEAWPVHPDNPENRVAEYLVWTEQIAALLKGQTAYYVLGDELTLHEKQDTPAASASPENDMAGRGDNVQIKQWTPEKYLEYFKQVAAAIKRADPAAKVSMFAASSGEWFNILYLLKIGYAQYGDAVAINYYNYQDVPKFFDDARRLAPQLLFLSNGIGYTSVATAEPRYPEGDPYTRYPTERDHGNVVAKNAFAWWDLGAATAPYYISLRNWVVKGKIYPRWFGFFGFEDYVIDENDHLTVKRYPAWYAYQTIAHTFYNRDQFLAPSFAVASSADLSMFRVYQHRLAEGSELIMMLWNDKGPVSAVIDIASADYRYPVRVDTFNYHNWISLPHTFDSAGCHIPLEVDSDPMIIRLVALPTP